MSQLNDIPDEEIEMIVDKVFTDEAFEDLFDPVVDATKIAIVKAYQKGHADGKAETSS